MVTQKFWIKLQKIASCSDGVFCSGTITNNQIERASLNKIIVDNKSMFKKIRSGRVAIYQLTGIFYSRYRLPFPRSLFTQLSNAEILSKCIWSAFIVENDLNAIMPSHPFEFNGQDVMLDDFQNHENYKCKVMLTCEDRHGFFAAKGMSCLVPVSCLSKWVRRMLSELFVNMPYEQEINDDLTVDINGKEVLIPREHAVENAIWPSSKHDCHEDKRNYGNLGNCTGLEKWEMDLSILPLWVKNNKPYKNIKFGIFRK